MTKKPNYTCPRCGYHIEHKGSMRTHLYSLKKPCPALIKVMELTDDIREHVLENRIYLEQPLAVVPVSPVSPAAQTMVHNFNQTINQIQFINNFVNQIDPMKAIETYQQHTNTTTIPLDTKLMNRFRNKLFSIDKAEKNNRLFSLGENSMYQTVDDASNSGKHVENINIYYDKATRKLSIYEHNKWNKYLCQEGIEKFMFAIQESYFDAYECYLIRKLNEFDGKGVQVARIEYEDLLNLYYGFIAYFDLKPYIAEKTNHDILTASFIEKDEDINSEYGDEDEEDEEDEDDTMTISDKYMPYFTRAKQNNTSRQTNEARNNVLGIIKRNSAESVKAVKEKVAELFRMDEIFKNSLMTNI